MRRSISGRPCKSWQDTDGSNIDHIMMASWKHFPRYWPFVRGIHRSPVNSLHKGQRRGALMFSLICAWINGWVNSHEADDLRRHRAHYDVTVMFIRTFHTHVIGPEWSHNYDFLLHKLMKMYHCKSGCWMCVLWCIINIILLSKLAYIYYISQRCKNPGVWQCSLIWNMCEKVSNFL